MYIRAHSPLRGWSSVHQEVHPARELSRISARGLSRCRDPAEALCIYADAPAVLESAVRSTRRLLEAVHVIVVPVALHANVCDARSAQHARGDVLTPAPVHS